MQTTNTTPTPETTNERPIPHGDLAGGAFLIGLGLFLLVAQWLSLGFLTLPVLGIGFTLWGILARNAGPLIPGGILNGIALGALAVEYGTPLIASEAARGGLFLLGFALGWESIVVLSKLFTSSPQRWANIPGGIMALIGAAVLAQENGFQILRLLGLLWPLILVAVGLPMIVQHYRKRQ